MNQPPSSTTTPTFPQHVRLSELGAPPPNNMLWGQRAIEFYYEPNMKNYQRCPLDHERLDGMNQLVYKLETDYHLLVHHAVDFLLPLWQHPSASHKVLWFINLFKSSDIREYFTLAWMNTFVESRFPNVPTEKDFKTTADRRNVSFWFRAEIKMKRTKMGQELFYQHLLADKPDYAAMSERAQTKFDGESRFCCVCHDTDGDQLTIQLCSNKHKVHDACAMGLFAMWMVENGAMLQGQVIPQHRSTPFPAHAGICPVCRVSEMTPTKVFDMYLELFEKHQAQPHNFTGGELPEVGEIRSHKELNDAMPVYVEYTEQEEWDIAERYADWEAAQVNEALSEEDSDYCSDREGGDEQFVRDLLANGQPVLPEDDLYNF